MSKQRNENSPLELDAATKDMARRLTDVADHIHPHPGFAASLEQRLVSAHQGPEVPSMFSLKKLAPAILWVLAAVLIVLAVDWAARSLAPEPVPAARSTKIATQVVPDPPVDQTTPVPSGQSYDWHGTTLYLATGLPDSPSEAGVYLAQPAQPATVEEALSLAQRFGIQGEVYETPGERSGTQDYLVTDGKQSLRVGSSQDFTYTADIVQSFNYFGTVQNPDADGILRAFLQSHGFTFPCRIEWSGFRSAYLVEPLTPAGTTLRYEHFALPMLQVTLDPDGRIATLQASLMDIQSEPAGRYGILSSDEAFHKLLDPNTVDGLIEGMNSSPAPIKQWRRSYPADQTITIYGRLSSAPAIEPNKPAFLQIDGFPAVGQVFGLDALSQTTYVAATGRFINENGAEKFSVDSWKVSDVREDGLVGTLQRGNGQTTLTTEDGGQYVLPEVPDDVPMPFEKAFVIGTRTGDVFEWKLIDDRAATQGGGGGGGGGGSGFYKLNLTGTPVPFPSETAASSAAGGSSLSGTQHTVQAGDTLGSIANAYGTDVGALMQANGITDPSMLTIGQTLTVPGSSSRQIDGLRGILSITISKHEDGSEQVAYGFLANAAGDPGGYMLLEGDNLQDLQAYNSRPVDIWGSLETSRDNSIPVVKVERFQVPFPDLQIQVLQGTQKLSQILGQPATLFTTEDGNTYVQLLSDGTTGSSLIGTEGDQVQVESVAVPGESLGGYPALRVFGGMLAIDPKTGLHMNLPITADKPAVVEMQFIGKTAEVPTATIEKVELVHFLSDPRYAVSQPGPRELYFQPAWRFYGHYSNGDEFEVLIQGLRKEYLLPEIEPSLQPG